MTLQEASDILGNHSKGFVIETVAFLSLDPKTEEDKRRLAAARIVLRNWSVYEKHQNESKRFNVRS